MYESTRIVVPHAGRQTILQLLHKPHSGIGKTRAAAQQLYYWPGISSDISQMVNSCQVCQERLPSQAQEPLQLSSADKPFAKVGVDLFQLSGQHYLVMVDRFSGFPLVHRLPSEKTSTTTDRLLYWFQDWGFPESIRSDGGPQFRGPFKEFCDKYNIVHELTSPHHPQSNGLAEAAVANVKSLLDKTGGKLNAEFRQALFEWRNAPRTDGYSPAQMVFGRRQRGLLPTLPKALDPINVNNAAKKRGKTQSKSLRADARELPPIAVGLLVRVQDQRTQRWNITGRVASLRDNGRSYLVELDGGKATLRNRRFIKLLH